MAKPLVWSMMVVGSYRAVVHTIPNHVPKRRAYAVQLGQVARGIEDMQYCEEKLLPFAEGQGTRVAFSDLKLLGTFLTTVQLTTIDERATS